MNVKGKPLATSATSDATFHSFLLGKSDWLVSNDSKYLCIYLRIYVYEYHLVLMKFQQNLNVK